MAYVRSSEQEPKKRRGRPPGSRNSIPKVKPATKPKPKSTAPKQKTGRKQSSREGEEDEDELSILDADAPQSSRTRKRRNHTEKDEIAEEQSQRSRKKYVQLETRTKRIPQEQIDTWPQVSQSVLEQIVSVIRDAKKDIANTQRDERKVIAAHNALNPLVRNLARKLEASRIPPQAKDVHFNIDKLTESNAAISREVTTARHSKQLLSEQVKVAQRLLRQDEQSLEELKSNAKEWRTEWKHREKQGRLHPLLSDRGDKNEHNDSPENIGFRSSEPSNTSLLDRPDGDLADLLNQLRRSLENLQNNHAQVEGIDVAMKDAYTALDSVLFKNASEQQYAAI